MNVHKKGVTANFTKLVWRFSVLPTLNYVELILLTARLWKELGIFEHVTLQLNSIGSLQARQNYRTALVAFLAQHLDLLSEEEKATI